MRVEDSARPLYRRRLAAVSARIAHIRQRILRRQAKLHAPPFILHTSDFNLQTLRSQVLTAALCGVRVLNVGLFFENSRSCGARHSDG
jgi:hypothetical protein